MENGGVKRAEVQKHLREVQVGQENILDIVKEALDGKDSLKISIANRELRPEPAKPPQRAESPMRKHCFGDVAGFINYLQKYKSEDTVIFGDVEQATFTAIIDEKAEKGFETITFKPIIHPAFKSWDVAAGRGPIDVRLFAEFLLANRRVITSPDGRELALTFSQVRVSTSISMQRGRGLKAVNGLVVETTIQGETESDMIELPETLRIETPLFINTPEVEIEVDLLVTAKEDTVFVSVNMPIIEMIKANVFQQLLADIQAAVGDKVVVSLGAPEHDTWKYIAG